MTITEQDEARKIAEIILPPSDIGDRELALVRAGIMAERERCAKAAHERINSFQDLVGWQTGESRNETIAEIRDAATAAIRAGKMS